MQYKPIWIKRGYTPRNPKRGITLEMSITILTIVLAIIVKIIHAFGYIGGKCNG